MATSIKEAVLFCFSLRAGFAALCLGYQVYFIWALTNSWPSLLIHTYARMLHYNFKTLGIAYNIIGIFIVILAGSGMIVREQKFILPLLFIEGFSFFLQLFTCGLLLTTNALGDEDKYFVKFVCRILIGYFAIILEYRVYRDLGRKTRTAVRPIRDPNSTIILLPSDPSHPIDPRAAPRQCNADRARSAINNSFPRRLRGIQSAPSSFLPIVIREETAFDNTGDPAVSQHSALSTIFCIAQQPPSNIRPRTPPPRYEP